MKNIIIKTLDIIENIYYLVKNNKGDIIALMIFVPFFLWILISTLQIGWCGTCSDWNAIGLLLEARQALM